MAKPTKTKEELKQQTLSDLEEEQRKFEEKKKKEEEQKRKEEERKRKEAVAKNLAANADKNPLEKAAEQNLQKIAQQQKEAEERKKQEAIAKSLVANSGKNPLEKSAEQNVLKTEEKRKKDEERKKLSEVSKNLVANADRNPLEKAAEQNVAKLPVPEKKKAEIRPHQQNIPREDPAFRYMTVPEKERYNFYKTVVGEDGAQNYLDSIREDINRRQAEAIYSGNEGKVLNEYIQGAVAGLESAKEGYKGTLNMLLGIDEPQPTGAYQYLGEMAREDLAKSGAKLPEVLGGASLGQIGYDVINTTANMLPSMILGTLGGSALGAAGIGASAAGNAYNAAINEGFDRDQATNYAVLVGASEASLGYLLGGIEATGGKIGKSAMAKILPKIDNALAKTALNVGSKMGSEFSEEYLQEVLDPVFRNIAFMEENKIDFLSEEAIYSGILGALSAGGIVVAGGTNVDTEVPVPFDGKAQPGTEAALVADKISEIENRPISEAEKAAKMEEVMQAVAESGTEPGLFEEAEKFKNIHEERASAENEYSKELTPQEIQELKKGAKIEIDETGEGIINISSDILKDVPRKKWIGKVKTVIKSIFPNGFYMNGEYVEISGNSRKEFTSSKYSRRLAYENPEIYADKMRTAPYLDMISQNAKNYNREDAEHDRTDNIVEFERGNITLKIGGNEYVADVVIGVKDNGGKKFYDITNIENKKSPQPGHKKADTREGGLLDVLSSNIIIPPVDEKSNPPSIGNNVFGAGIFGKGEAEAVSAEITESAKRVLDQMVQRPEIQSTTSQVNPESESTNPVDVPQSKKSARIERRYQRTVEEGIASVFGVSRSDLKGDIKPLIEEITAELKAGKKISDAQIEKIYKTAFEDGIITEEFPQYDAVRRHIRSTPIYVDKVTRDEFGDDFAFRDFARSNFGSMKISSDPRSRHIDDFYKTLSDMAPEFFDENETDPVTQLENIADFMQQTKKQYYGLSEVYSGETLADFEKWAKGELRNYMDEFVKGVDVIERYERDRRIKATNKAREIDRSASFEEAKAAFNGNAIFEARKGMEKAKANALLNDSDLVVVKRLHEGTLTEADVMALGENVQGILDVYNAEKAYKQVRAPFDRYRMAYKTALLHDAVEITESSDEWTDKKIGFAYSRETAERNIRDITENGRHGGEKVLEEYIAPVHEHEAMKTRWIREMNSRVKALELGKMNRYERAYAQMIGENAAFIAEGKLTKHDRAEHDALNERIENLFNEHGKKIDKEKCEKAAAGFMDIYEDILAEWNNERIRRGQEPVGKIEGYFPHFVEAKPESTLQKIFSLFGFDVGSSKLPTDIAGRTADRKPNTKYNPHANKRFTDATDYDILKGFDGYVRAVGDNIFHTEDIQKLRALSDTIRTKYSSAEIEKRIEDIRNKNDLSEEDKEALIADAFKTAPGAYHLSNFVVWLDEYTNILAGKKSRGDREAEYQMGREIYDISKALEGRIASNMIGYNLSTPVMNFVPMFQATADVSPVDIVSSVLQTGVAAAKGDSFISENSDFLTNRFGVDSVYKQNYNIFSAENVKDFVSKIGDGGSLLMEFVDRIVSESLVRARVTQNFRKGMDSASAFAEADEWAAGLIADRSLGALPTVFNIKNPVAKAVTMFQVEANNQYSYIFKDAGKYKWDKKGALSTISGQLAFWAAMAICNGLADELLGRDNVVPDPIGMTAEALEKLRNGEKTGDIALDTATNIVEQIPFVGGLLGGGRVPISTALPDFEQSIKLLNPEVSAEKKGQILFDELMKPLSYIFLPSGAGQLWKTGKGIGQLFEGGAYGMNDDGSRYLKFPQEYDPESILKTVLFGQYAGDRGQQYIDSGFKDKLSAKQTEDMELAEDWGISKSEFYDTVLGLREYSKKADKQEALFENESFTAGEKGILEQILFGNEETRDYSDEDAFYRSGLSDSGKRLFDAGYSKEDIESVEKAVAKSGKKEDDVANIEKALGCSETEAFEIYQKRNGDWNFEIPENETARAQGAADFYGMSTDDYLTVLNYSKFGKLVENENGEESYSTKIEDVIPKIMEATGWDEETTRGNYLMVNKYEYSREDIEEAQTFDLDTSQSWYEVEDKGYFVARNVLKTVEGTKDEYGNTVSGSKKEAAVKEIAKQLGIDEEEATIYYLAANGDLVLSADDLSSSQIEDMKAAVAEGWTERQFLDAVNVVKLSGATKKDDIIKALKDAGATDEMARGYYNLRQNYDYDKVSSSGAKTYSYGMANQKQVDKANYFLENYNSDGKVTSKDLAKWYAAAAGCKKKKEYLDAYMSAGATYSQALQFYNLMRGYDDNFNVWYKENGG